MATATKPYTAFADDHFAGKTVLITGAASGMGLATAHAFATKGAQVVMFDKDDAALTRSAADYRDAGLNVHDVAMDVADQDSIDAGFGWCDENIGRIDNLVTCAAIMSAKRIFDQDWALWRKVLDVNLMGTFFVVQAAARRMQAGGIGGNIVCVASDAGVNGGGGLVADTPYAASKAATLSMVKSVARELSGQKIRINALNPGPTDSPFLDFVDPGLKSKIAASLPLGRLGHPDDMSAAIMFLCSDAAQFVYGAAIDVNGGSMFR